MKRITLTYKQIAELWARDLKSRKPVGAMAVLVSTPVNVPAALKVRALGRALTPPFSDFEHLRNQLVQQYGENKEIDSTSPRWPEFSAEYQELLNSEVEIETPELSADELWHRVNGQREPIDITAQHLEQLDPWLQH